MQSTEKVTIKAKEANQVGGLIGWLSSASQLALSVTAQVTANGIALPLIGTTEAQTPTSTFDSLSSSVSRIMNEMMSAIM